MKELTEQQLIAACTTVAGETDDFIARHLTESVSDIIAVTSVMFARLLVANEMTDTIDEFRSIIDEAMSEHYGDPDGRPSRVH